MNLLADYRRQCCESSGQMVAEESKIRGCREMDEEQSFTVPEVEKMKKESSRGQMFMYLVEKGGIWLKRRDYFYLGFCLWVFI
jgi:hypothetical protein